VLISLERPEAVSALNILPAMIRAMTPAPGLGLIDLELDCAGTGLVARITAKSAQHLRLAPGAQVFAIIKSVAIE
jgi:molybdate transport system ATP-binding protein